MPAAVTLGPNDELRLDDMTYNIVVAYDEFPDLSLEKQVLSGIDAALKQIHGLDSSETQDAASAADALMVTTHPVRRDLLQRMTRCKIISRVGTGLDSIDISAATEYGIWVTNVPDYSVDEVSSHTIALLLAQARRLPKLLELTRQGIWDSKSVRPFERLSGQTLGVVGFGRIARAVAAKAQGLGLRILAYDPYIDASSIEATGAKAVSLETLLRESDFVALHTPLTESTRHIINREALALMKPTAFLINTARGPLIDEDALLEVVRAGRIAGAALDVLTVEPPPPDHPLLHEEHVLVTPHTAWYSEAANRDVRVRGAEEVLRVLRGEKPRFPANQISPKG